MTLFCAVSTSSQVIPGCQDACAHGRSGNHRRPPGSCHGLCHGIPNFWLDRYSTPSKAAAPCGSMSAVQAQMQSHQKSAFSFVTVTMLLSAVLPVSVPMTPGALLAYDPQAGRYSICDTFGNCIGMLSRPLNEHAPSSGGPLGQAQPDRNSWIRSLSGCLALLTCRQKFEPPGPHLCLKVHPHHCQCERAPASSLALILHRHSHPGPPGSCGPCRLLPPPLRCLPLPHPLRRHCRLLLWCHGNQLHT